MNDMFRELEFAFFVDNIGPVDYVSVSRLRDEAF